MADTMNERESNLSFDFWAAGSELAPLIIEDDFFFFFPPRLMFYIHPYTLFFLRKLRKPAWLNLY